jgi:capsular exopolysaccharide synthesis family protein
MSKFFEALEQAERDRALREQEGRPEPVAARPEVATTSAFPAPYGWGPAAWEQTEPGERFPDDTGERSVSNPTAATSADLEGDPVGQVDDHLVSLLAPTAFGAEQYRSIRHFIEEQHKDAGLSVVAISSPAVDEGKTTTAINLAGALAQSPAARVLVLEADLRRPSLLKYLGLDGTNGPGLVDIILQPDLSLESGVRRCASFNLAVLPAGVARSATYELLKSPRLGELFAQARERYDYVIVDTPPLCPIPDGRVLVKWVDGVVLVAAAHKTPRKLLEEALEMLTAPPIAMVFNGDDQPSRPYYTGYANEHLSSRWGRLVRRPRGR